MTFTTVASGTWATGPTPKVVEWRPVTAGFIRFTAKAGSGYTNVAGLRVGGRTAMPVRQSFAVAPDRAYKIINATSDKALTVLNGSTANRAAVVLAPDTNGVNQQWTLSTDVDGFYKLKDTNSGKLLEIGFRSRAIGEKAAIWSDADVVQQLWGGDTCGQGNGGPHQPLLDLCAWPDRRSDNRRSQHGAAALSRLRPPAVVTRRCHGQVTRPHPDGDGKLRR